MKVDLPRRDLAIRLEKVSYVPPGAREPALRSVDLDIAAGEVVGIVGPSGAGKTTLARLLVAVTSPTQGRCTIGGVEGRHWTPENLAKTVGYLPQTVGLFPGTIRENIARFARATDDEVIQAATRANVHDMVMALPDGYETQVDEGGSSLSGGQRQRIGLARAMFGSPRLLVLDEPNAHLDADGEEALAAALATLKSEGSTIVLIAPPQPDRARRPGHRDVQGRSPARRPARARVPQGQDRAGSFDSARTGGARMKLDFLSLGGGAAPLPRRAIERRMRALDIRPLDHANRTIRIGLIAGAVFVLLFVAYAAFAPISAAAIAEAEVSVSGDKIVIQPVSGGIVTQVLVREGQRVRESQPLVRLNGVRSGASLAQAQARRDSLRALETRLIAERDGLATLDFPPDVATRASDPAVAQAIATQRRIFARHLAVLGADRATSGEDVVAARARHNASQQQLALISDELRDYRSLYARGFARKTTIRSLERTQAQLNADTLSGQAALNQAEIAEKRIRDAQALDLTSQLGQVQEQLAQVTPQLDVTRYAADHDVMRAPAAGRVSGVTAMGPGMIVGGGRTLIEIVPDGRALIVEALVKPQDIDDVRAGQTATIRFSWVNPHGKAAFTGHVVTLSPARVDEGGKSYYKAQVTLDDPTAARREGLTLQPGIPASVNIRTQERTLFDYLFAPLSDAVSRSFREE